MRMRERHLRYEARSARWLVEQQTREPALGQPQQEQAFEPEQQLRFPGRPGRRTESDFGPECRRY